MLNNIRTTSAPGFVAALDAMIKRGRQPSRVYSDWEWIAWRWVRVYIAEFTQPPAATLTLEFGPVRERELPDLSEGDCAHVSID